MKKILCLFGAMTLLLTSCSSNDDYSPEEENDNDDNNNPGTEVVLLKKTIITDSEGDKLTRVYSYDGNKLISIVDNSGDSNSYYTYTGNLITKLEYKYPDGSIDQINKYAYDDAGKLTTFWRLDPEMDLGNKEVYTYNADGTITAQMYIGDAETQTMESGIATIKFINGEVSEIISSTGNQPDHKYTYDTKNHPLKNVTGMDKIAFVDGEADGVKVNILTDTSDGDLWTNSTITYNEKGYPIKDVDTGSDSLGTTEFFY